MESGRGGSEQQERCAVVDAVDAAAVDTTQPISFRELGPGAGGSGCETKRETKNAKKIAHMLVL